MATVQAALVDRAARLLHQIGAGQSLGTTESAAALVALNAMHDSWRIEKLMCLARRVETVTLTSGAASKTIGPSGDLNTVRPVQVLDAWIEVSGYAYPVRLINDDDYESIDVKTQSGDWPTHANYRATMPTGTIYTWPVANATRSLKILVPVPLSALVLTDTLDVAPGWEDCLASNLAVRLAPEYETVASQDLKEMARDTKAAVKRMNRVPVRQRSQLADIVGSPVSGNILSGP
jgi:hypothetical protein